MSRRDDTRIYRACGLACLIMTLVAGAMAAVGHPGMWLCTAFGAVEAYGFAYVVLKAPDPSHPDARGETSK